MIPLADFQPLSAAKTNRGFTERYFSDKVHAIIEEVGVQTTLRDVASLLEIGLKCSHQPSNFVINILT